MALSFEGGPQSQTHETFIPHEIDSDTHQPSPIINLDALTKNLYAKYIKPMMHFSTHGKKNEENADVSETATPEVINGDMNSAESAMIVELVKTAKELTERTLTKISERLGSNDGGWYLDEESGKKYYIKFYENPDQARVEYVANAIYNKIGIRSVQSELFYMNDKLAIASEEIPGSTSTDLSQQQNSPEVRDGFIADSYLANWDVVGLVHDNIVKGEDGHMHRIDNGGSLIYRAQGGIKDFSPDEIPEISTMLNPSYSAGKVFAGTTREHEISQAKQLVENLSVQDIEEIVNRADFDEEKKKYILDGLIGRRNYLIKVFGLDIAPEERTEEPSRPSIFTEIIKKLDGTPQTDIRPKEVLIADKSHIENQLIEIVDARDMGYFMVSLKLTSQQYDEVLDRISSSTDKDAGQIVYTQKTGAEHSPYQPTNFTVCDAIELRRDDIVIKIADYKSGNSGGLIHSARGLVQIFIPCSQDEKINPVQLERDINQILVDHLLVPEGTQTPDQISERKYMRARYAWQHKLDPVTLSEEEWGEIESRLIREEIVPGYSTIIDKGAHERYEAISPLAIYSTLSDPSLITRIILSGAMMSSHERYKRGSLIKGMSTAPDFATGGADSVFTRMVTEAGLENDYDRTLDNGTYVVYDRSILDRTDWYAYSDDKYGSTAPETFDSERKSPESIINEQTARGFWSTRGNELMFRTAIPISKIKCFVIATYDSSEMDSRTTYQQLHLNKTEEEFRLLWDHNPEQLYELYQSASEYDKSIFLSNKRLSIIFSLLDKGVTEVNGIPLSKFVVYQKTYQDILNISNDRTE